MLGRRTVGRLVAASGIAATVPARARDLSRVVVAVQNDVLTLDPTRDISVIAQITYRNMFEALLGTAPDGKLIGRIAHSWKASADLKEWTFDLRPGVKFHDGTPVTADDVVWSYNKLQTDPTSPYRAWVSRIAGVEKAGNAQVRINLVAPFASFDRIALLIFIIPRAAYERLGAQEFSRSPIGSGPFRVKKWVKDDRIELEAFDDYWGGTPKIRQLTFRPVPSEATRAAALASGELDVVPDLPLALYDRLSALPTVRVVKAPTFRVAYLGYNVGTPPLDKLEVRQAIDMGIDRKSIATKLLRGMGVPMAVLSSPVTVGFDPSATPTPYDPGRARTLLKEAGYSGTPITLQYPSNRDPSADQVAQAIAGSLKDVGLNIRLQSMEFGAFSPLWVRKKLEGLYFNSYGTTDAEPQLANLYESGGQGYWQSPELDALVRAQRSEADPAKRLEHISAIWRKSQANVLYSPLYQVVSLYGVAKELQWEPRADGVLLFNEASWKST